MKKTSLLIALAVAATVSCTKTTNNTTVIAPLPAFTINGIHDVTLENGFITYPYLTEVSLPISIQYADSTQQTVVLALSALPAGITMDSAEWISTGIPSFSTTLTLFDTTAAGATPGTYPMTLTASGSITGKKTYAFNIKVVAEPPCTSYIVGSYTNSYSTCSGSTYTDNVTADASTTNKIWFSNLNNTGLKIYAMFNCNSDVLTVPAQTVGGVTYSGSGSAYYSGASREIGLELSNGVTSCNITMTN